MTPETEQRLREALAAASLIEHHTRDMTQQSFHDDDWIRGAAHHQLVIIGEAFNQARRVDPHLTNLLPDVQGWVGLRNVIIHDYPNVRHEITWDTIRREIPILIESLRTILGDKSPPHLIVDQLAFARSELVRSMEGVSDEDAKRRLGQMNCLSWIVGHLADQEQRYFLQRQGLDLVVPGINDLCGYGKPASTPPLAEMWAAWNAITAATVPVLETMSDDDLLASPSFGEPPTTDSNGTLILRVTTHYWFHIGEGQAIRQMLGHTGLADFVGNIGEQAPFRLS